MLPRFLLAKCCGLCRNPQRKTLILWRFVDAAFLTVLHDQIHFFILLILNHLDQSYDIRVVKLLQNGNFTPDDIISLVVWIFRKHLFLKFVQIQNFNCIHLVGQSVLTHFDLGKCSSANQLFYQILVNFHLSIF